MCVCVNLLDDCVTSATDGGGVVGRRRGGPPTSSEVLQDLDAPAGVSSQPQEHLYTPG